MTDVFLLWHTSHALRANVSSTPTMTETLRATSKLVMMRNFWASPPAMPLPRQNVRVCPGAAQIQRRT